MAFGVTFGFHANSPTPTIRPITTVRILNRKSFFLFIIIIYYCGDAEKHLKFLFMCCLCVLFGFFFFPQGFCLMRWSVCAVVFCVKVSFFHTQ